MHFLCIWMGLSLSCPCPPAASYQHPIFYKWTITIHWTRGLTWLLKVLISRVPRVSDFQQTGFHSLQIHLWAVALWIVHGTLAPAVIVPTHKLAFFITADVAEGSLDKASPQILRENGLKTCKRDENSSHEYLFATVEIAGRIEFITHPYFF